MTKRRRNRGHWPLKGAVRKYGKEGSGRDLTGWTKLVGAKRWAKKLLQVTNMGFEAIYFQDLFQYFTNVLNTVSVNH